MILQRKRKLFVHQNAFQNIQKIFRAHRRVLIFADIP